MSRDTKLTAPDGSVWSMDNLMVEGQWVGAAVGLEVAAAYLLTRAGELFQRGKDEEAKTYRQLARTFEGMAKSQRERTHKRLVEYPPMIMSVATTNTSQKPAT